MGRAFSFVAAAPGYQGTAIWFCRSNEQLKVKVKDYVKDDGQECPSHTRGEDDSVQGVQDFQGTG